MERIVNRLLAVTLLFAALFGAAAYLLRNTSHDDVAEGERDFAVCEYIDVDLQKLDVTMIPYDGENIRVSYKDDLPLSFELGDNRLSITESTDFVVSLFTGRESDFGLYLYLPRRSFRDISVIAGSGDIKVGRVDSLRLSLLTESGDIICENMVSLGRLTTTTGFISVNFEQVMTDTEILSRRGDVEMILPPESSVAVDFRTDTGECAAELWDGQLYGSRVYSFNGGDKTIYASVESGTLTIK